MHSALIHLVPFIAITPAALTFKNTVIRIKILPSDREINNLIKHSVRMFMMKDKRLKDNNDDTFCRYMKNLYL